MKPSLPTQLNGIGVLWGVLSLLGCAASSVGFYLPYWLKGTIRNETVSYLGTFRRCNYPRLTRSGDVEIILECGRYTTFSDIPSPWWQLTTIVVGIGCGLAALVAFLILFGCCLADVFGKASAKVSGIIQLLAAILIGGGCSLYPYGWTNPEVYQVCGPDAAPYKLGHCELWWAFYMTAGGAGMTIVCSVLSCCSIKYARVKKRHRYNGGPYGL